MESGELLMSKVFNDGLSFDSGLVAIIRTNSIDEARNFARALTDAGVDLIEFTTTTPGAFDLIAEFSAVQGLHVGLGTAMNESDVTNAKSAGAEFIISPHTSEAVIKSSKKAGLVAIPGVATPTEIADAISFGADILKFFPASSLGASYLKSMRDPFPGQTWMATGGIALGDVESWIKAGASGFGLGGPLTSGGIGEIAMRVGDFRKAIKDAK